VPEDLLLQLGALRGGFLQSVAVSRQPLPKGQLLEVLRLGLLQAEAKVVEALQLQGLLLGALQQGALLIMALPVPAVLLRPSPAEAPLQESLLLGPQSQGAPAREAQLGALLPRVLVPAALPAALAETLLTRSRPLVALLLYV